MIETIFTPGVCEAKQQLNGLSLENLGVVDDYNKLRIINGIPEETIQQEVIAAADTLGAYEVQMLGLCALNCSDDICLLRDTSVGEELTELLNEEQTSFKRLLEQEKSAFTIIELEGSWEFTRSVVEARLNVLKNPVFLQMLADEHNKQQSEVGTINVDDYAEMITDHITPFKDEKAWQALHDFTKGNIRNALYITSYFMEVFPKFRSADPVIIIDAESIARGHGDIFYKVPGFRPSNPCEIQELDFHKLADTMRTTGQKGWLNLPDSSCSSHGINITDNPDDYAEWGIKNGELIDVSYSDKSLLPPKILLALESGDTKTIPESEV